MSELKLDMAQCLHFLDTLDPGGRHSLASEAPLGGKDDGPRWLGGATFEPERRDLLIKYIEQKQKEKANVYYSVNRPCHIKYQKGSHGKNNIDDIIGVRALAFDIDFTKAKTPELVVSLKKFISQNLDGVEVPSMLISTGGGYQLIYLLAKSFNINLYRPPKDDYEKGINEKIIELRTGYRQLSYDFEALLRSKVPRDLPIKIDNMSNIDRVMRLPGTVNYPKLEKQAKGQIPALATIEVENCHKIEMSKLRNQIPRTQAQPDRTQKRAFIPRKDDPWTAYAKAKACIDFIRDNGLADSNETYTIHVMLPLIGAIHDDESHNALTLEEAEELFLEAVSGGERYGTMGRGEGYFRRQWRSHRPELKRNGQKKLGGLIWFCTEHGMTLPWAIEKHDTTEFELYQATASNQLKKFLW